MASFVMLKLAENFKDTYPEAAEIIRRDRYMDDLIHSCDTFDEAKKRMQHLEEILATGSFQVKEWFTSPDNRSGNEDKRSQTIHGSTGKEIVTASPDFNMDDGQGSTKTLGVIWVSSSDNIGFRVKDFETSVLTKRVVLSWMSMLYDPLGLASVVTIKSRIAMQEIWRLKLDWDDPLPSVLEEAWRVIFNDLKKLESVRFPRCIKPKDAVGQSELHVFADASICAYGAAAYQLWPTTDGSSVRLVCAKARVAPLRQTTVPRLELMAALLASRLAQTLYDNLTVKPDVFIWIDSQIVLHWIRSESITLKPFVGVRVAEIQSTWNSTHWRYVPSELNPADDLSRGVCVAKIKDRWMIGPDFLRKPKEEWPEQPTIHVPTTDVERKSIKPVCSVLQDQNLSFMDCTAFSNWQRLLRVTAYCFRFVNNLKSKISNSVEKKMDAILSSELQDAENYWIMHTQANMIDYGTKYTDLAPFKEAGIIRVGGRLRKSCLPFEEVHPVLLPASSYISKLIMRDTHNRTSHSGYERTLCDRRRRYWIVKGRSLARETVRKCVVCRKLRQRPHVTLMADLPADRLKAFCPVFTTTGIDLFGPFNLRYGRNGIKKAWGALFTCATVRAIHLEIVDDLSTKAFLQSLRRFAAHHGWPTTIISDNGSSFVGCERELRKIVQDGSSQVKVEIHHPFESSPGRVLRKPH